MKIIDLKEYRNYNIEQDFPEPCYDYITQYDMNWEYRDKKGHLHKWKEIEYPYEHNLPFTTDTHCIPSIIEINAFSDYYSYVCEECGEELNYPNNPSRTTISILVRPEIGRVTTTIKIEGVVLEVGEEVKVINMPIPTLKEMDGFVIQSGADFQIVLPSNSYSVIRSITRFM